jgi:hypothetical protein
LDVEASPPPPAGYDPSRYGDYPYGPPQPGPYPYGPPQKRGGLPAWAIVLIVVAVVGPIVAGIFAAIAIPAFVTQHDKAQDSSVKEGAHLIRIGIESWAADNGGVYPQLGDVSPEGGIAPYVDPWPINPWTDAAMQPGTQRGDYRYVPAPDGSDYELLVFLSDGQALKIH